MHCNQYLLFAHILYHAHGSKDTRCTKQESTAIQPCYYARYYHFGDFGELWWISWSSYISVLAIFANLSCQAFLRQVRLSSSRVFFFSLRESYDLIRSRKTGMICYFWVSVLNRFRFPDQIYGYSFCRILYSEQFGLCWALWTNFPSWFSR